MRRVQPNVRTQQTHSFEMFPGHVGKNGNEKNVQWKNDLRLLFNERQKNYFITSQHLKNYSKNANMQKRKKMVTV